MIARTIPALVFGAADRFPEIEALVDGEVRLTFPQLRDEIIRAARAFLAAGISAGDRVAVWAPNTWEWVVGALGAQFAGAALVPINTRFKGAEAADVLLRSDAAALLTVNGFLGTDYVSMLRSSGVELPSLRDIVVMCGDPPEGCSGWDAFLTRGASIRADSIGALVADAAPEAVSDIIFTSGTTGRPRGVVCTQGQTLRVFEDWSGIVGLEAGDRYLIVNPFFHTFGYKAGVLACLLRGATIVPEAVFDVDRVLAKVAAERISVLPGPPTLYFSILANEHRADHDLSSLRLAVTGAAAVPVELLRRMREELSFRTIITGYGLTESTGTISMCRPQDAPETISTTSGRAIHDVEVRVVDDGGMEVARGATGEIVCRGYNVMQGYLDDPEATAEAIDADGWLHTGDIGTMDERGYLQITDRKKDIFIVGGFNAYPAEIEGMILRYPGVAQVAVVGVPGARLGEVGVAYVVPRPGDVVDPDSLLTWCRAEMANFKVPSAVHVVDALPLNASGKVLKYELRARA
ncbi:MAG: FadD3 family acyl-CoA ligase [Acidimicrobiia bacterium]